MTREHILRKKWADIMAEAGGAPLQPGEQKHFGWFQDQEGQAAPYERTFTGNLFEATIKDVCADCNNGWMNDLENAVEPFLTPMLFGARLRLTAQERFDLARWIAKTAIVVARAAGCVNTYSRDETGPLVEGGMPPTMTVWAMTRPVEGVVWSRLSPMNFDEDKDQIFPADANFMLQTLSFLGVCFVAVHGTQPDMLTALRMFVRASCGKPIYKRRWSLGKYPRERFKTPYPEMNPDYHSALIRHWAELAEMEHVEGTNFPYPG